MRTRAIAREYGAFLLAACPARHEDALLALRTGSSWPGDAILWCRVDHGTATIPDRSPRGIPSGRSRPIERL
jgi:hypothetical protein